MHVYSKAEIIYVWLGREEVDGTRTVFGFPESLLNPYSNMFLILTSHTCGLRIQAAAPSRRRWRLHKRLNRPAYQNPPQSGDCQRCMLESSFQGLQCILECEYWKRRWIIQETFASYRQFLLCGDAAVTLDEMNRAVSLCRKSCDWNSGVVKVSSWFNIIMTFRTFYQGNARPSLCQAIKLSREFKSTDPRDAIFSLLGVYLEGLQLIPTPNYSQPITHIMRDLTKALIQKYKSLNFILINGIDRAIRPGLQRLPFWAPNWLSGNLPPRAYRLAVENRKRDRPRVCFSDTIDRNYSLGQGKILRVQGIYIGRVVTMTSITNPSDDVSSPYPNQLIRSAPLTGSHNRSYYTETEVLTALISCLSLDYQGRHARFPEHFQDFFFHFIFTNARVTWYTFCVQCMSTKSQPSHLNAEIGDVGSTKAHSRRMLSEWLETNAMFEIRGRALKGWIKEEHSILAPILRMFDSIFGIPFMILVVLLIQGPFITIAVLLSTRYRNNLKGNQLALMAIEIIGIGLAAINLLMSVNTYNSIADYHRMSKQRPHYWTPPVNPSKRLIVADKGFLSMVDDRALEGDMFFNLVRCPESVLLRKVGGGRKRYIIVGDCYVHLTPTDQDEYFGPVNEIQKQDTSQQEAEKAKWLNGSRKQRLKEIELV